MGTGGDTISRRAATWAARAVAALLVAALLAFSGQMALAAPLGSAGSAGLSAQVAAVPSVRIAGVNVVGSTERALESGVEYAAGSGTAKYSFSDGVITLELTNATISARSSASISKWISISAASYPVVVSLAGTNSVMLPSGLSNAGKWGIEIANSANVSIAGTGSLRVSGFKPSYGAISMDVGSTLSIGASGAPAVIATGARLTDASKVEVRGGSVTCGYMAATAYSQTGGIASIASSASSGFADSLKAKTFSMSAGTLNVAGPRGIVAVALTMSGGSFNVSGAGIEATTAKVTGGRVSITGLSGSDVAIKTKIGSKIKLACAAVPSGRLEFYGSKGLTYYAASLASKTAVFTGATSSMSSAKLNAVKFNGKTYKVTAVDDHALQSSGAKTLATAAFGNNVRKIGSYVCKNCKKLTSVTCGTGLTKIGAKAFFNCKKLKSITIRSKKLTKAGVRKSLSGSSVSTVMVPAKKVKAYKKYFKKSNCGKKVTVKAI